MNSYYECTSEGSNCLQKQFDGILFTSSLHVIPKESALNRNTALSTELTENSCNSAFPYKAANLLSESGFTETYFLHSACVQFLSDQNQTESACRAVNLDHVDSAHLNNSDKLS